MLLSLTDEFYIHLGFDIKLICIRASFKFNFVIVFLVISISEGFTNMSVDLVKLITLFCSCPCFKDLIYLKHLIDKCAT